MSDTAGKTWGAEVASDLIRIVDGWLEMERRHVGGTPPNITIANAKHRDVQMLCDEMRASVASAIDAERDDAAKAEREAILKLLCDMPISTTRLDHVRYEIRARGAAQ